MRKNQLGVSLITVVIAITILSIAAFVFMQMTGTFLFAGSRLDKSLRGQQVLVGVASDIQRQDFAYITQTLCKLTNGETEKSLTGNCIENNTLKPLSSQTTPPAGSPLINVLLSENGKVSATGDTCVELQKCTILADGNMVQLQLMAYWLSPDTKKQLLSRVQLLRRTRW